MYTLNLDTLVLRDAPKYEFNRRDVERYFKQGFKLFSLRLEELRTTDRTLTESERKELKFMLEALIDAKDYLVRN